MSFSQSSRQAPNSEGPLHLSFIKKTTLIKLTNKCERQMRRILLVWSLPCVPGLASICDKRLTRSVKKSSFHLRLKNHAEAFPFPWIQPENAHWAHTGKDNIKKGVDVLDWMLLAYHCKLHSLECYCLRYIISNYAEVGHSPCRSLPQLLELFL